MTDPAPAAPSHRASRRAAALALWAAAAFLPFAGAARAASVDIGVGAYDVLDENKALTLHGEYESGWSWGPVRAFGGVMLSADRAAHMYGGLRLPIALTDRASVSLSFAPGLYHDGDGKDLGHAVEFRSALRGAYTFGDGRRLSVAVSHLSNASLSSNNPGTEIVSVSWSAPMAWWPR